MNACHGTLMSEILSMKDRMDFLYRETVREVRSDPESAHDGDRKWEPLADTFEDDQEWIAVVDLPGVSESDLTVEMRSNILTLTGKRSHRPHGGKEALECQRPQGPFKKEWVLPENIEPDQVSADYRNGVLTIVVPKRPAPARKVPVRSEI